MRKLLMFLSIYMFISAGLLAQNAVYNGGNGTGYASATVTNILLNLHNASGIKPIIVSPNPAMVGAELHFSENSLTDGIVQILNMEGKVLETLEYKQTGFILPLGILPGTYILLIKNENTSYNAKISIKL